MDVSHIMFKARQSSYTQLSMMLFDTIWYCLYGHRNLGVSVSLEFLLAPREGPHLSGPDSWACRRFRSAGWSPGRWCRSCTRLLSAKRRLRGDALGPSTSLCVQHWDFDVEGVSSPEIPDALFFLSPSTTLMLAMGAEYTLAFWAD